MNTSVLMAHSAAEHALANNVARSLEVRALTKRGRLLIASMPGSARTRSANVRRAIMALEVFARGRARRQGGSMLAAQGEEFRAAPNARCADDLTGSVAHLFPAAEMNALAACCAQGSGGGEVRHAGTGLADLCGKLGRVARC